jgi:hypothetical protein
LGAVVDRELGVCAFVAVDESLQVSSTLSVVRARLEAAWMRGEYVAAGTLEQSAPIGKSSSEALLVRLKDRAGNAFRVHAAFDVADGVIEWGAVTHRRESSTT